MIYGLIFAAYLSLFFFAAWVYRVGKTSPLYVKSTVMYNASTNNFRVFFLFELIQPFLKT